MEFKNDGEDQSSLQIRKDWQNMKKIIFNRDYLIVFIAASIVVIDIMILVGFVLDTKKPIDSTTSITSSTVTQTEESSLKSETASDEESTCNVAGINLHGDIVTYITPDGYNDLGELKVDSVSSENVYSAIKLAEKTEAIKAILVEIDSGGGDPVAAEEIAQVIKNSSKPVIVYIRGVGASAAYWAATGASRIFAMPSSQVGSIAVNSSYLDESKYNEKSGYTFNDLATGKFKNTMSNEKPLTAEEKTLIMKDINITHEEFVKTVAKNRKLDINKVRELANGWAYTGVEALQLGLIDELGSFDDVNNYIEKSTLKGEELEICW